jgi:hypothetical protein
MTAPAQTPWSGRLVRQQDFDFDLVDAWQRGDPKVEADVIAFWGRLGALPATVAPHDRARQLTCVAYRNGAIVGVATAYIEYLERLRTKFAFIRNLVHPDQRRSLVSSAVTARSREVLESWSLAHPEEGVLGMATVVQSAQLAGRAKYPIWENSGMNLIGYTEDGQQVRVSWFAHARID